ncbi:MAG: hypothetical protein EX271_11845 [Acidimicrobiales bacterium]|nr:hypothetical protein [Hyphomonadaceae bacterium]RZV36963.1 MAG: hypothetical protein EX271_11845 [Acidimicrobiales bacterium]
MMKKQIIQTCRDKSGSTLVEFSLLLGFLLFTTFGIVEGGYIFYQVNGAQKATQAAARYAATRPPVAKNLNECVTSGSLPSVNAGTDCSLLTGVSYDKVVCQYTGAETSDCSQANFLPIRDQMKAVFPFIEDENIWITYEGTGLGYIGRGKPVPAITVELRNIQYSYVVLGQLMRWQGSDIGTAFNISNVQTTVIGEDIGEGA